MKKQLEYFSHIFRKITARVKKVLLSVIASPAKGGAWQSLSYSQRLLRQSLRSFLAMTTKNKSKICFLLGIAYLLFLTLPLPLTSFEKTKMQAFFHPNVAQGHFLLSQFFQQANNLNLAEKEVKLAQNLEPGNKEITNTLGEILNKKNEPRRLQQELSYWQKISQEKKGFRDAFFQEAIILYQLKRFKEAKSVLQKVFELDPNFEPGRKLEKLFTLSFPL